MDKGPAKRLVVYVSENQRWHHKPVWREVVDLCHKHGLAGTTFRDRPPELGAWTPRRTRGEHGHDGTSRARISRPVRCRSSR